MHPENRYSYYFSSTLKIYFVEGLSKNWQWLTELDSNTYLFNIVPFNLKLAHLNEFYQYWSTTKFINQIIWLMNTQQQVEWATSLGMKAIWVNHNCWLDETLYNILPINRKYYQAVINSRPFLWKRVYLADNISNLAYICGSDYTNGHLWQWSPWYRTYGWINLEPIKDIQKIVTILNQSKVGLILSGSTGNNQQNDYEGACYSCSEYLLCGLPVVSTISEGGRDVWLTSNNSIICQPDKDIIYQAVNKLEQISDNQRQQIRQQHIELQWIFRHRFIEYVNQLFKQYDIVIDGLSYFKSKFINKMTQYL